jgi:ribose transport system permease protein
VEVIKESTAMLDAGRQIIGATSVRVHPRHTPKLADHLIRLRYTMFPDHIVGEILAKRWIDNLASVVFLILVVTIFGTLIPDFFAPSTLVNNARQLGEFGFVVMAMMIVMVGGGIDLSVGSNFALGNFVSLATMNLLNTSPWLALTATLAACGVVGLVNGVLVGFLRLRAFLTTLVTLIIVRALVDMLLLRYAVVISATVPDSDFWSFIGDGTVLGMPFSTMLLLTATLIGHVLLSRTRPGWRLIAVGGSRRSAHNAGISVRRTVCGTYVISGLLCGVAGFLYAARLSSAGPDTGVGLELGALTAAILGGNSLGGGRGSTGKALMGAIIVLIVQNGVVRLGLQSGSGAMVLGLILLLAIAVDVRWLKNRDKVLNKLYVSPAYVVLPEAPPTAVGSASPYEVNDKLRNVEIIGLGTVEGPEDVIFDRADNLYTGTRHGDIVRFLAPDYRVHEVFAHIGGHPLGMAFDRAENLVACVGGMGLYQVRPDRTVEKLTDETNRTPWSINDDARLRLADDLDIAPDGRVFFSEATIRYEMHSWPVDALESRGNGRIICYDPARDATRTVLRNLVFPNGICVTTDGQSILFAETWQGRIRRYWFDGPKAGRTETVIASLPGYPDNINRASDGNYWLAVVGMRSPALDLALQMPGFRRRMARRTAPDEWLYPNINTGCVLKFDEQGRVLETLWDLGGLNHPMITSMREHKGNLYLGGISNNRIGRYSIPGADMDWTGWDSYWGAPLRAGRQMEVSA